MRFQVLGGRACGIGMLCLFLRRSMRVLSALTQVQVLWVVAGHEIEKTKEIANQTRSS